jgi:hypothetical protein
VSNSLKARFWREWRRNGGTYRDVEDGPPVVLVVVEEVEVSDNDDMVDDDDTGVLVGGGSAVVVVVVVVVVVLVGSGVVVEVEVGGSEVAVLVIPMVVVNGGEVEDGSTEVIVDERGVDEAVEDVEIIGVVERDGVEVVKVERGDVIVIDVVGLDDVVSVVSEGEVNECEIVEIDADVGVGVGVDVIGAVSDVSVEMEGESVNEVVSGKDTEDADAKMVEDDSDKDMQGGVKKKGFCLAIHFESGSHD